VNDKDFNRTQWRDEHPQDEITAIIQVTVRYAREILGVKRLGAVGFCFGGPYVVRQLAKNIDAGFIAHPGAFSNDELSAITGPLAIAAAETDSSFNFTRRREVEDLLVKNKAAYQINLYSGTSHGFGVRVNMRDRKQVFAKQAAFLQAVMWFDEWLKGSDRATKYVDAKDLRVDHDFEYSY
jgi:dienelactone hydrolase